MVDLRKLFARDPPGGDQGRDTEVNPSLRSGENLESEYESLISTQCRRWGISGNSVSVQVRQLGRAGDGRIVYVGMLRLTKWDRVSALRMLIGLPLLEAKLRKAVRNLWLGEVSHFSGLWLHASEQLSSTPAMKELRDVMLELTPVFPGGNSGAGGASRRSEESSLSSVSNSSLPGSSLPGSSLGPTTGPAPLPRTPPESTRSPLSTGGVPLGTGHAPLPRREPPDDPVKH
jgi:hypothetical protein